MLNKFGLRYLVPLLVTLLITLVYSVAPISLFSLDITKRVRLALFHLTSNPRFEESIVLLNIGKLSPEELEVKIDSIVKCNPEKVGVNLCHYNTDIRSLKQHFSSNSKVVIATCANGAEGSLSRIVNQDNSVSHFKTDRDDYFEFTITHPIERENEIERIYFIDPRKTFYHLELAKIAILPEYIQGRTVLVGYLGDYLTDSTYYFTNNRISPLNELFQKGEATPDMFDTDISALILHQIHSSNFISEIKLIPKILIILLFCFVNVVAITYLRTRWITANILITLVIFILMSFGSSALVLYAFTKRYYLEIDEAMIVILITSIFTVGLNFVEERRLKKLPTTK